MRFASMLFGYLLMTFTFITTPQSLGWRGIIPLHSTKADVERILGQAPDEKIHIYTLKDGDVYVVYSKGSCEEDSSFDWNVPPDTVIKFTFTPKRLPLLSELNIDRTKFEVMDDSHVDDYQYLINKEEGLMLTMSRPTGEVTHFDYGPAARDTYLRCPGYDGITYSSDIPKPLRARLLESLNKFAEYQRTEDYEKQYELYLPEFAALMFEAKNKQEYAEWMHKYGGSWQPSQRLIEFKPITIFTNFTKEDGEDGKVYNVFGLAKILEKGEVVEGHRKTQLVLKGGKLYFADLFDLIP